jgi:hypothetical protein
MRVSDQIFKSVVFIGAKNDQGEPVYRGTAFLVSVPGAHGDPSWIYLVTAGHVAKKIENSDFVVRVNRPAQDPVVIDGSGAKWWYHPNAEENVDAAVTPFNPSSEAGALDVAFLPTAMFMSDATARNNNIGIWGSGVCHGLVYKLTTHLAQFTHPQNR